MRLRGGKHPEESVYNCYVPLRSQAKEPVATFMNPVEPAPSSAVQSCPICNSRKSSKYWAIIAPFISDYVRPSHSSLLSLCECRNCQHRFFDYRYSNAEMDRLYSEYRSETYLLHAIA